MGDLQGRGIGGAPWRRIDDGAGELIRHQVSSGSDRWAIEGAEWKLFRTPMKAVLDNSGSTGEFHDVVDNRREVPAARAFHEHAGDEPIEVRFERGERPGQVAIRERDGGAVGLR